MTAKEFIIKELEDFIKRFPQVRVRYEYRTISNAHFIEIIPNETYRLDKDYISWEFDVDDRFSELFPIEGICFISDDALVGIENAIYIKEGLNYAPISTIQKNVAFDAHPTIRENAIFNSTFSIDTKECYIENKQVQYNYQNKIYLLAA